MKTKHLCQTALVITAAAALSCNGIFQETLRETVCCNPSGECLLSVTIDEGGGMSGTKVPGDRNSDEQTVNDIQLFVFDNGTGRVDAVYHQAGLISGTTSFSSPAISCTAGDRTVFAIVNSPEDLTTGTQVRTLSDLRNKTFSIDSQAGNFFTMTGSASVTLSPGTATVHITVSRLVSSVVLSRVENRLVAPYSGCSLNLTGAFLLNVPGVQNLDGSISASSPASPASSWRGWYSRQTTGSVSALLSENISAVAVPFGESHREPHTFYSFANDVCVSSADGKSKSNTILVVECSIDGVPCVYPIYLPELVANHRYLVGLTIEHLGTDPSEPWRRINISQASVNIVINEWEDVNYSDTI